MGHYGKHIIDPQTGLCEICDKNAIQDFRQGKRLDPQDPYEYSANGEPMGSYIRKSVNSTVPPPIQAPLMPPQPRRVVFEDTNELPAIPRRVVRHSSLPTREVIYRPSLAYDSQVYPQYGTPVSGRPVRVVKQYAQTPPPPASAVWVAGPRRQTNSGVIVQRTPRIAREQVYYQPAAPSNLGTQYVRAGPTIAHQTSLKSAIPGPRVYQIEGNRRPYQVEPLERRVVVQPQPTVVRRVYRKLPPGKYDSLSSRSFRVSPQPPPPPPPVPQQPIVYHIRLED
ncbi:unnamed protein product [Adineta ricciae]|uniref:Uncharacterized protein n=1 Tax=Adineta ricciae TaxID=249248 RepID=A0A813PHF8_ADIRI|nr:unnamed protein product [Adineta ricciae]CAF1102425.1 unnamed protein product [Adineta ricciae]